MSLPGQAKPLSQSPDSMHRIKKRNRKSKPKPIELRKWVLLRNGRRAERQWLLLRDSAQEQRLIFLPSTPLTPVTPNAATKRRHSAVRFGHSLPASLFRTSSQFLWKDQPASPLPPTASKRYISQSSTPRQPLFPFQLPAMGIELTHEEGDVVQKVWEQGVIVHACNCLGAWGSGIALELKQQFPAAYKVYEQHCKRDNSIEDIFGTCLLIPPQPADYEATTRSSTANKAVWIACLFTSVGYGKPNKQRGNPGVSSKQDIIGATGTSLMSFLLQWQDARSDEVEVENEAEVTGAAQPGDIFCPKFNAGSFNVPWEKTEELIEQKWGDVDVKWAVISK